METRKKRVRKHKQTDTRIFLIVAVIVLVIGIALVTKRDTRQEMEPERRQIKTVETVTIEQVPDTDAENIIEIEEAAGETVDRYAVFDTMSEDWGADDLEGFTYFEIPERYAENGGYFPEKMQIYTYCLCRQYGVRYSLIVALIEHESGYVFDSIGDDGKSFGYMQVNEAAHTDRMEELDCDDLLNPYQNVRVGIDYLASLIEKYGTMQDALAAYNYGERGVYQHLWSNGIYVYGYNSEIMSRMKEIEEKLQE